MEINYNLPLIQQQLNNFNEAENPCCISVLNNYEDIHLHENMLSCLTDSTSGKFDKFDISKRINVYLNCIQQHLKTVEDCFATVIAEQSDAENAEHYDLTSSLDLNSCMNEVWSNEGIFGLTQQLALQSLTMRNLSAFCADSLCVLATQQKDCDIGKFYLSDVKQLFNNQNINIQPKQLVNSISFNLTADGNKSSIIKLYDIKTRLNMLILLLKRIYRFDIILQHLAGNCNTIVTAYGNLEITETKTANDIMSQVIAGKNIQLTISPFKTINSDSIGKHIDSQNEGNLIVASQAGIKLNLPLLVYDTSSLASLKTSIPQNINGSNGIFSNSIKVDKIENFNLKLDDVCKMFNIIENQLIKRTDILRAIDYIFNTWINNISAIQYTIQTCHSNCHTNSTIVTLDTNIIYTAVRQSLINIYVNINACTCTIRSGGIINISNITNVKDSKVNIYANIDVKTGPNTLYIEIYQDNPSGTKIWSGNLTSEKQLIKSNFFVTGRQLKFYVNAPDLATTSNKNIDVILYVQYQMNN